MKTILVITLLTLSFNSSAQILDEIQLKPRAALDYFPTGSNLLTEWADGNSEFIYFGKYSIRSGVTAQYKKIGIALDQQIYMKDITKRVAFRPHVAKWDVSVFYQITDKLQVSFEHSCIHPIETWTADFMKIYGGHRRISLSYGY